MCCSVRRARGGQVDSDGVIASSVPVVDTAGALHLPPESQRQPGVGPDSAHVSLSERHRREGRRDGRYGLVSASAESIQAGGVRDTYEGATWRSDSAAKPAGNTRGCHMQATWDFAACPFRASD